MFVNSVNSTPFRGFFTVSDDVEKRVHSTGTMQISPKNTYSIVHVLGGSAPYMDDNKVANWTSYHVKETPDEIVQAIYEAGKNGEIATLKSLYA